jgi:hypothetical protein
MWFGLDHTDIYTILTQFTSTTKITTTASTATTTDTSTTTTTRATTKDACILPVNHCDLHQPKRYGRPRSGTAKWSCCGVEREIEASTSPPVLYTSAGIIPTVLATVAIDAIITSPTRRPSMPSLTSPTQPRMPP